MGTLSSELRPIAAELSDRPRVYVDANLPAGLVAWMRQTLEWDVLFVLEDDELRRASDLVHYQRAREFGRTLITLDYDFADDGRFPRSDSPGVVICSAPDEPRLTKLMRDVDRKLLRPPTGVLPLRGRKVEVAPGAEPRDV